MLCAYIPKAGVCKRNHMIEPFIAKLIRDFELGEISLTTEVEGVYSLPLEEGLDIKITEIPGGVYFSCGVAPFPKTNGEIFTTQAMFGNLFGQGTRGAVLGLSLDGNTLTLTRAIDYNIEYKEFKEILEDFITAVDLWREEAMNHK